MADDIITGLQDIQYAIFHQLDTIGSGDLIGATAVAIPLGKNIPVPIREAMSIKRDELNAIVAKYAEQRNAAKLANQGMVASPEAIQTLYRGLLPSLEENLPPEQKNELTKVLRSNIANSIRGEREMASSWKKAGIAVEKARAPLSEAERTSSRQRMEDMAAERNRREVAPLSDAERSASRQRMEDMAEARKINDRVMAEEIRGTGEGAMLDVQRTASRQRMEAMAAERAARMPIREAYVKGDGLLQQFKAALTTRLNEAGMSPGAIAPIVDKAAGKLSAGLGETISAAATFSPEATKEIIERAGSMTYSGDKAMVGDKHLADVIRGIADKHKITTIPPIVAETVKAAEAAAPSATKPATAAAESVAEEVKTMASRWKNMSRGGKFAIVGGTVALVGGIGYWAFHVKQSRQQAKEQSNAQTAGARAS